VIGVLSLLRARSHLLLPLVEKLVALDHVVDDGALGDLLGLELSLRRQVLSVVVSEMVVRRDGERLDSSVDEELGENGLDLRYEREKEREREKSAIEVEVGRKAKREEGQTKATNLGLSGLEIVSSDEGLLLLGELDESRNTGVLGSSVDEGASLEDRSDGKEGRGRDLVVRLGDGGEKVLRSIVDSRNDLGVPLGVGGPEEDDLVESVGSLREKKAESARRVEGSETEARKRNEP